MGLFIQEEQFRFSPNQFLGEALSSQIVPTPEKNGAPLA